MTYDEDGLTPEIVALISMILNHGIQGDPKTTMILFCDKDNHWQVMERTTEELPYHTVYQVEGSSIDTTEYLEVAKDISASAISVMKNRKFLRRK